MKRFLEVISSIWKIEELKTRIGITLGLLIVYRIGQVVEHDDTAVIQGMINKVKHLVTVQNA